METIHSNSNEHLFFEIINSKNQDFVLWAETAMKAIEVYNLFSNRHYTKLPVLYTVPEEDNLILKIPYINFELEVLLINETGKIFDIVIIKESNEAKEIKIQGSKYVLLAPIGLSELFSIKASVSNFRIRKEKIFAITDTSEKIKLNTLTTKVIVESVLSEKDGKGLRSKIPSVYVWYHDLLFFVDKKGFPGHSASTDIKDISIKAIEDLKMSGIKILMLDAVYPRKYFSRVNEISCTDTWWGMRNNGTFIR